MVCQLAVAGARTSAVPESGCYGDNKAGPASIELKYGFPLDVCVHSTPGGAESPDEVPGVGTDCFLPSVSYLAWIEYNSGKQHGVKRSVDDSESAESSGTALAMLAARRGSKTALEMAVLVRS